MIRIALLLLVALLGACRSTPQRPGPTADAAPALLLAPVSLGHSVHADQQLEAWFGERQLQLRCAVAVDAHRLQVVGLSPAGQRLFTVQQDASGIDAQSAIPGVLEGLRPEWLIADLQLAFWPLAALQQAYPVDQGWALSIDEDGGNRLLRRNGRLMVQIHRASPDVEAWNGRVLVVNYWFDYALDISSQRLR